MRLKEDNSSWKSSGIRRRDKKHEKPPGEVAKHQSTRKDTKKWCKGKEGVEHKYQWQLVKWYGSSDWWEEICVECSKKRDYWFKSKWFTKPKPQGIP